MTSRLKMTTLCYIAVAAIASLNINRLSVSAALVQVPFLGLPSTRMRSDDNLTPNRCRSRAPCKATSASRCIDTGTDEYLEPTTTTANSPQRKTSTNTMHLISLPHLSDECPRIIRDVWKWKDIVLGDGRDYFVPRPRALKALSDVLVGIECDKFLVKECAILSNCARMDVLLSLEEVTVINSTCVPHATRTSESSDKLNIQSTAEEAAKRIVAACLIAQLESFQKQRSVSGALMESISSFLDLPGMVDASGIVPISKESSDNDINNSPGESRFPQQDDLSSLLCGTSSIEEIVKHFCLVASGLAPRASRPGRAVLFRPFSSRDAHIMLQIKRTSEVAKQYTKVKIVLDASLSAGKLARDPKHLPILNDLKGYDCEGKYSQAAPPQLAKEVAERVIKLAIDPAVQRCRQRLNVLELSEEIVLLRRAAAQLYDENDREAEKVVRHLLHQPCMDIRNGVYVEIEQVLSDIQAAMMN